MNRTYCPNCNAPMQVPDHYIGETVNCPSCSQSFTAQKSTAPPKSSKPAPQKTPSKVSEASNDYKSSSLVHIYQTIAILALLGGLLISLGMKGTPYSVFIPTVLIASLSSALGCYAVSAVIDALQEIAWRMRRRDKAEGIR